MSDSRREELSSLIDEAVEPEVLHRGLNELAGDEALRGVWTRYHLIGHALRGEPVRVEYQGVAARVASRLREEPALLIPMPRSIPRLPRLGTFGAYALAASVALIAVLALPPLWEDRSSPGVRLADQSPTPLEPSVSAVPSPWSEGRPAVEQKLTRFLVNHQEYAPASGMKGVLPYATFVAYEGRR